MSVGSSPTSLHTRSARVFTFSPSFQRHNQYFHFSPPPVSKISSPSHTPKSDLSLEEPNKRSSRRLEKSLSPMETIIRNAFVSDFEQHCRRIVPEKEVFLTYNQLEELLIDLHFVSGFPTRAEECRDLSVKMWKFLRDPETGQATKELAKRVLMEVVGIEKLGLQVDLQREFRSFAVNRLRYLHLQEHAITGQSGVLRNQVLNAAPEPERFPNAETCRKRAGTTTSPYLFDKENAISSPKIKPMLPLGRDPAELRLRKAGAKCSPSPLRIPQVKSPFATVKVNLTPAKFDVINVFDGDAVDDLARKFAQKHSLGSSDTNKLKRLLESKLAAFRES